jgi:hypothetical protein
MMYNCVDVDVSCLCESEINVKKNVINRRVHFYVIPRRDQYYTKKKNVTCFFSVTQFRQNQSGIGCDFATGERNE